MCEKKARGTPSLNYDATLRCSPKRKYERRTISATYNPAAKQHLNFDSPAGSVGSSSLGRPNGGGNFFQKLNRSVDLNVPDTVGAHDGFEDAEGGKPVEEVEKDLAKVVNQLHLKLSQEQPGPSNTYKEPAKEQMPELTYGGGSESHIVQVRVAPNMQQFMPLQSTPGISDMIPAIRNLSDSTTSLSSDVQMVAADSVLGKRAAEEKEVQGKKLDLKLSLTYEEEEGAKQKRGRKTGAGQGRQDTGEKMEGNTGTMTRQKAAAGRGASGPLTRSNVWSRQGQ